jgi:hypothetical protein
MVLEVSTKLTPEEVILRAKKFFGAGPGGVGLQVTEDSECCLTFVGGGGHVTVSATDGQPHTSVEIETAEWDWQVKEFSRQIAG